MCQGAQMLTRTCKENAVHIASFLFTGIKQKYQGKAFNCFSEIVFANPKRHKKPNPKAENKKGGVSRVFNC